MDNRKCPICEFDKTDELIVDLLICNNCSHIFKNIAKDNGEHLFSQLHLFQDPIFEIRKIVESMEVGRGLELVFPSMNFYTLELHPTDFYHSTINHYFNQKSLMILLNRCGLSITKQENVWSGTICETKIRIKVKR